MKAEVTPFDAAEHLDNEEVIAAFLAGSWQDSLEDDNPDLFVRALSAVARARGMTRLARDSGLGRESLYKALTPGRKPQFATTARIMRGLDVRLDLRPSSGAAPK